MLKLPFSGYGSLFVFLMLMMFQKTDTAQDCPASSCGGTNISYPFRLHTDPVTCGDDLYKLSCENNFTVLHPIGGGKYHVQAINYNNFTIRLVDAGVNKDDCSSIPSFPLTNSDDFSLQGLYDLYKYKQNSESMSEWEKLPAEMISFIECKTAVNSSAYLNTSPCINSSSLSRSVMYSYAYIGKITGKDLRDGCSIEMVSLMLPIRRDSNNRNLSFTEVHSQMAFGFELSWHNFYCRHCVSDYCYQDSKDHIHCPFGTKSDARYPAFYIILKLYVEVVFRAIGRAITGWCVHFWNLCGGHRNLDIVLQKIKGNNWRVVPIKCLTYAIYTITLPVMMLTLRNLCGLPLVVAFWVYDKLSDGKLEIEDARDEENEIVRKMIITGLWCIQMQPSTRPPMNKVVEMLEGDLGGLQLPPRPLLYPEKSMQQEQDGEQSSVDFSESSSSQIEISLLSFLNC